LPDVFARTWRHVPPAAEVAGFPAASADFWGEAIAAARRINPRFLMLAEAYWDLEERLCGLGFDYAYDKVLYDRLVHDRHADVQPHLLGLGERNTRRAHFLENHDEPRVASTMPDLAQHRAALLTVLGLPGMRFLHDGELEGRRRFARIQLARRASEGEGESVDADVRAMYGRVLAAVRASDVGQGVATVHAPEPAWADNTTSKSFVVVSHHRRRGEGGDGFDLVVVNLAPHRAQCRVRLPAPLPTAHGGTWRLVDRLGDERWIRDGAEMAGPGPTQGLFLDLPGRGAQLFAVERIASSSR
jgi:hypothetical protein